MKYLKKHKIVKTEYSKMVTLTEALDLINAGKDNEVVVYVDKDKIVIKKAD